jgi:hypothetical protein
MTEQQPHEYEFGYLPRNKYKDLVFYVKTGEHSNMGLFEMPDNPENRALMEALRSRPAMEPETKQAYRNGYDDGYETGAAQAREDFAKELSEIIKSEWMCDLPEILYIIECVSKGNGNPFLQHEARR